MNKRIYIASADYTDYIIAYVANSSKEAKKMAMCDDFFADLDNPFIDISIKWQKEIDASKYPIGDLGLVEGLRLGVYTWCEEVECDKCGTQTACTLINDEIVCEECE